MQRRTLTIMTAATMMAVAGQAIGQQGQQDRQDQRQDQREQKREMMQKQHEYPSAAEAERIIQSLKESNTTLADAIQLAERDSKGKALAAHVMKRSDVQSYYSRQRGTPGAERGLERPSDPPQETEEERRREAQQPGNQQDIRQTQPHAAVICLADGQLKKVIVNLDEKRVVDTHSLAMGAEDTRFGDTTSAGAREARLASKVLNTNVVNTQGDDLGEINDLALDISGGKVRYAAVTRGGFLGMGGKMLAVPLHAFQFSGEDRAVLNVSEEQLKQREGFDEDQWPQQPQGDWGAGQPDARDAQERQRRIDGAGQAGGTVEKASDVIGSNLRGTGDEDLGEIDDIVIKSSDGSIEYLLVSKDDGHIAVPVSAVRMANERVIISMDKRSFDLLPTFRDKERQNWSDPSFKRQIDQRFDNPQRPGQDRPGGG